MAFWKRFLSNFCRTLLMFVVFAIFIAGIQVALSATVWMFGGAAAMAIIIAFVVSFLVFWAWLDTKNDT